MYVCTSFHHQQWWNPFHGRSSRLPVSLQGINYPWQIFNLLFYTLAFQLYLFLLTNNSVVVYRWIFCIYSMVLGCNVLFRCVSVKTSSYSNYPYREPGFICWKNSVWRLFSTFCTIIYHVLTIDLDKLSSWTISTLLGVCFICGNFIQSSDTMCVSSRKITRNYFRGEMYYNFDIIILWVTRKRIFIGFFVVTRLLKMSQKLYNW